MDIKRTTAEIHQKLDKLGLSNRWGISYTLPISGGGTWPTLGYQPRYRLIGKYLTLDVGVNDRTVVAAFIIFGGKLRIKR